APATDALDLSRLTALDFLVPNQTELATLSGKVVDTLDDVEPACRVLIEQGVRAVIVTLGGDGVFYVDAEQSFRLPSVAVDVRDTTGAGDAFVGSFALYYVREGDIKSALRKAIRYAADSVTRLGTQSSYADRQSFEAMVASM